MMDAVGLLSEDPDDFSFGREVVDGNPRLVTCQVPLSPSVPQKTEICLVRPLSTTFAHAAIILSLIFPINVVCPGR